MPKEAYDQWTEAVNDPSKRADVKAFYIKGMVKDGQGELFNAWVKPNFERNKMDFFRWNPDRAKRQGAEVKPAVESRTQVAVNSEGKTVEAVKGVKEPLKQGQQEATLTQKKITAAAKEQLQRCQGITYEMVLYAGRSHAAPDRGTGRLVPPAG